MGTPYTRVRDLAYMRGSEPEREIGYIRHSEPGMS